MRKALSSKAVQLLIIIIAASVISTVLTTIKNNEYSDWISTDAVITDWKMSKKVKHIIYFKYNVNGTEHTGQDSFSGNFPEEEIGDTVTVWYDPDDPLRVMRSDIKPDAGLWTYAPFFLALPISLFVITEGYNRKRKGL